LARGGNGLEGMKGLSQAVGVRGGSIDKISVAVARMVRGGSKGGPHIALGEEPGGRKKSKRGGGGRQNVADCTRGGKKKGKRKPKHTSGEETKGVAQRP